MITGVHQRVHSQ